MNNELLTTALRFASQGIVCVPVASDGSKRPAVSWKEYQERKPTTEELLGWFSGNTYDGLGVITGEVSGLLEMLEFEGRAVAKGLHLEARSAIDSAGLGDIWLRLVNGYMEMTPSGGIHFLYRVVGNSLPGNTKLASQAGDDGGCLIETRSEGGFCITAPSGGNAHPSGKAWEIASGSIETIPIITLSEREELFRILRTFDEVPHNDIVRQEVTKTEIDLTQPGDDYSSKTTWVEILEPAGWKRVFTDRQGVTFWRRPGKNEGISASTGFGDYDNFYVFTTSTSFEANKSYSKFAVYAHLNHRDDFRSASQALRSLGYGSQGLQSLGDSFLVGKKPDIEYDEATGEIIEPESSWKPVGLSDYYDGLFKEVKANILTRTDGKSLIYAGKVHSFYGESESGKSWVAQIATAELLRADKKVIYIDFESDPQDIVKRLKGLGVSRANLLQYLTYIRPESARSVDDPYWESILEPNSASLVVIDGVTESLTMWGGETVDNDSITKWMRAFPRTVASRSGAAVVLIDHITKNSETRGRFAIGGQAKLATIDGAAYIVEPIEVLSPGRVGSLTLRVTKDRIGDVRASAGMYRKSDRTQEAAVFTIDSTKAAMQYVIGAPTSENELTERTETKKLSEMAEFIHNHPGCSRRELNDGIKGDKNLIGQRLDILERRGLIINKGTATKSNLWITSDGMDNFGLVEARISYIGGAGE